MGWAAMAVAASVRVLLVTTREALRASGPVGYCGLATLGAFEGWAGVLDAVDGAIAVPPGPGLVGGLGELPAG